jgi:hypothetical protein
MGYMVDGVKERVQRQARGFGSGLRILSELERPEMSRRMADTVDTGVPAVSAVADILTRKFPDDMENPSVRRFVGAAINSIMSEMGFEIARSGARVRAGGFTVGSVYRRSGKPEAGDVDVLRRVLDALTREERAFVRRYLR